MSEESGQTIAAVGADHAAESMTAFGLSEQLTNVTRRRENTIDVDVTDL